MRRHKPLTPLGLEIKKRLLDVGMNHQELARLAGTSPQYLTYIINGERSGEKYLEQITGILGLPYSGIRGA